MTRSSGRSTGHGKRRKWVVLMFKMGAAVPDTRASKSAETRIRIVCVHLPCSTVVVINSSLIFLVALPYGITARARTRDFSARGVIGPTGDGKYERSRLTRPCPSSLGRRLAGWLVVVGSTTRSHKRVPLGAGQGERYGKATENGSPKRAASERRRGRIHRHQPASQQKNAD
jgi:hypothetical protein